MANTFASEASGYLNSTPPVMSNGAIHAARVYRYRAKITLASQASGDTITLAKIPANRGFMYGVINTDTSLGTATVSVGPSSSAAKYKAAAVFTSTDTPTLFGKNAPVVADPLSAEETVLLTIGTAALPSSGNLVVDLYFSGV